MTSASASSDARQWIGRIDELIAESDLLNDRDGLPMVGGANLMSRSVHHAMASNIGLRPRVRSLDERLRGPRHAADEIEIIAKDLLGRLFKARFAEVRVLSGSLANLQVYLALAQPGDSILALPRTNGGHASHGAEGAAGLRGLVCSSIPCHAGTYLIDHDQLADDIARQRPQLVIVGSSVPLVNYDLRRLARTVHEAGAKLIYDAAHVAGLIAGGRFQDPLSEGADAVTLSTYKTLNGPAGGAILTNDPEIAERLDRISWPGLTANFDMARVAGLAVACAELLEFGAEYADDCMRNAVELASRLEEHEVLVWSPDGGRSVTSSHMLAIDAAKWPSAQDAVRLAHSCNVFASSIPLPERPKGGVRLGLHQLTRLGMRTPDMGELAQLISTAFRQESEPDAVRRQVARFRSDFQRIGYSFD